MNNTSVTSSKPENTLAAHGALFKIVTSHVEFARSLKPNEAIYHDETIFRLTEAWTCIGTILTLSRNIMRKSHGLVESDPFWEKTNQVKAYALELLEIGNTWPWPRWAGGFEYIDIAMRTVRMVVAELQPHEARTLVPWLVRQAIYHDDIDEDRLYGTVEIIHWGDLLGTAKNDGLPEEEMPLAYWMLSRLYGKETVLMHRLLHGDEWCSWKGLTQNRNHPLDLRPLYELINGTRHNVLNPDTLHGNIELPDDVSDAQE